MEDCIFCSIANGDSDKLVWQNDVAVAFKALHPDAPVHLLVVPKKHVQSLDQLEDAQLAGQLLMAAREVAHVSGVQNAWRLRVNTGARGGQVIHHLHFHVLGARPGQEFNLLPTAA
jgi:histidine triad (HIT) family protein